MTNETKSSGHGLFLEKEDHHTNLVVRVANNIRATEFHNHDPEVMPVVNIARPMLNFLKPNRQDIHKAKYIMYVDNYTRGD